MPKTHRRRWNRYARPNTNPRKAALIFDPQGSQEHRPRQDGLAQPVQVVMQDPNAGPLQKCTHGMVPKQRRMPTIALVAGRAA